MKLAGVYSNISATSSPIGFAPWRTGAGSIIYSLRSGSAGNGCTASLRQIFLTFFPGGV
jgi:hypothetical protein